MGARSEKFVKKYDKLGAIQDLSAVAPDFEEKKTRFKEYYGTEYPRLQSAEEAFRSLIQLLVKSDDFPLPKVISRVKDRNSCIDKFNEKYRNDIERTGQDYRIQEHITDLIGVRVICIYENDIVKVESILVENFTVLARTDKTSKIEAEDDKFGYKGIHLDLCLDDRRRVLPENASFALQRFEVQIRSIAQDAWSEVDHKLKYKKNIPVALKRRINCLAALFELADKEFMAIQQAIADHEIAASQSIETASRDDTFNVSLDAFTFLAFMKKFDSDYDFDPIKADEFVGVMQLFSPNITLDYVNDAVKKNGEKVKEYRKILRQRGININPYTRIRHILYATDPNTFRDIIYPNNRVSFDQWLSEGR